MFILLLLLLALRGLSCGLRVSKSSNGLASGGIPEHRHINGFINCVKLSSTSDKDKISGKPTESVIDDSDIERTINLPKNLWPSRSSFIKAGLKRQFEVQKYWEEENVYEKICEKRMLGLIQGGATKSDILEKVKLILDGPPYANGDIHYGHFLNKTIKDVILRFLLLDGYLAIMIPGWDCHGMPIEKKVIQTATRCDLASYLTNDKINNEKDQTILLRSKCKEYAKECVQRQMATFKKSGIWGFWNNYYGTYHSYYERMIFDSFIKLKNEGFIYRGSLPQHFSPVTNSVLAESEILTENSEVLTGFFSFSLIDWQDLLKKIKFSNNSIVSVKLVAWTTMPWTIPGNKGLAINSQLNYSLYLVRDGDDGKGSGVVYIMANNDKCCLFDESCKIGEITGDLLDGMEYESILYGNKYKLYSESFVSPYKGTGIIHLCPAHGINDFNCISKDSNFKVFDKEFINDPFIISNIIDERECYYEGVHALLDGKNIQSVDDELLRSIFGDNLIKTERLSFPVGLDWRNFNRVHVRITEQWCLDISKKDEFLRRLESIEMYPDSSKNYLRNAVMNRRGDWCISRQRVWGTPIPVITCKYEDIDLESLERILSTDDISRIIHKSYSSEKETFEKMLDIEMIPDYGLGDKVWAKIPLKPDIIDVWFESGLSWKCNLNILSVILDKLVQNCTSKDPNVYIGSGWNNFLKKYHISTYAIEGHDQHRGWYQSSLILHTLLCNSTKPFADTIITHGFVKDSLGSKLSKSHPKTDFDAKDTNIKEEYANQSLDKIIGSDYCTDSEFDWRPELCGSDVLRLWACSNDFLQKDIELNEKNMQEAKDFEKKLVNFFKFVIGCTSDLELEEIDHTKLNGLDLHFWSASYNLCTDVRRYYAKGKLYRVVGKLERFLSGLSNLYISYIKDALYVEPRYSFERTSVQYVLRQIMQNVKFAIAPIMPHLAEDLHQFLNSGEGTCKTERGSLFSLRWPQIPNFLGDPDVSRHVKVILDLRRFINCKSQKNNEKDLLLIYTDYDTIKQLLHCETKLKIDLRLLFNVADVELRHDADPSGRGGPIRGDCDKYAIDIHPTDFIKCRRSADYHF